MLKPKIQTELNAQLNREFDAAYQYFGMSAYCESKNLDGFAHWLKVQAQEELEHAMKIYKYMLDRDAQIQLASVPEAPATFGSIQEVFEKALQNEQKYGEIFEELSRLATEEHDNTTVHFLNWFLEEQVEEVAICSNILEKVKMIGSDGNGLLLLNEDLKRRPQSEEGSE